MSTKTHKKPKCWRIRRSTRYCGTSLFWLFRGYYVHFMTPNHYAKTFNISPILTPGLGGKPNHNRIRRRHHLPHMHTHQSVFPTNPQPPVTLAICSTFFVVFLSFPWSFSIRFSINQLCKSPLLQQNAVSEADSPFSSQNWEFSGMDGRPPPPCKERRFLAI